MGLTAALSAVVLALTGFLLVHTDSLQLADRPVTWSWLLDWYGLSATDEALGFRVGQRWVSEIGGHVYLDDAEVATVAGSLIGAIQVDKLIVVADNDSLLLITSEGETVEHLGEAEGVPAGIQAISRDLKGNLAIRAVDGDYRFDLDRLDWHGPTALNVDWVLPVAVPLGLGKRLAAKYRGEGLPLERVLLDLHSGRILGTWGVYLVDAMALLILLLAVSGVWLWTSQRRTMSAQCRATAANDD